MNADGAALVLKPRLRGVSHGIAFVLALPLGALLSFEAETGLARTAATIFTASVALMFGASALYHCVTWSSSRRRLLRRLDHIGIYALIAGTYTAIGLVILRGDWRWVVLAIVWAGATAAVLAKLVWIDAPKWLSVAAAVALGWAGVVASPQLVTGLGLGGSLLVVAGGVGYTAGALVYVFRRPDPYPNVFGYHEVFHALVIAAVACQYVAVAFFVLPAR